MNKRFPRYPDDADYQTNAPSYYEDLARKQKLIEMLAKKIWEYEETLDLTLEEITNRLESYIEENDNLMADRLEQWDLNLEKFPENVELLLQEWLSDGTLDHIINDTIFNWKADKTYVDSEIERLDQKDENLTEQLTQIELSVKSFGAIGDGVTDDTQSIQNAADFAFENGLLLGGRGTFLISETLKLRGNMNLTGVTLLYNGSGTAVEFGLASEKTKDVTVNLPVIQKLDRIWSDDIGVNIINTSESHIHFSKITDFGVGIQVSAFSMGSVYNTFYLSHLENNEVNLKLKLSDPSGWVNENLFIGGRFSHYSSNDSHLENVSHIVFDSVEGSPYQPNNNVFLKPSLEGHIPYYTAIIFGNNNTIINGRYEGKGTQRIKFKDQNGMGSNNNLLFHGYDSYRLVIESDPLSVRNSIETTLFSKTVGSNEDGGIINLQNRIGDSASIIRLFSPHQDINNPNDYVVDWSANELKIKNRTDDFPKIILNSNGRIYLGDGTTTPTHSFEYNENGTIFKGGIFLHNHSWEENLLRLGNYCLWVDTLGKLRIKSGKPTNDTDGTVVGS